MSDPIDHSRPRATTVLTWLREWGPGLVAGLALATVGAAAGTISYTHIDALTMALGGSGLAGHLMPVAVDGQIIVGSFILLTATGATARWGWLGIGCGLAESLFANWESGISRGYFAAGWAMVAALAFAVASFSFERWVKAQFSQGGSGGSRGSAEQEAEEAATEGELSNPCTHTVGGTAEQALVQAHLHARDCLGEPISQRALAASFGIGRPRVAELVSGRMPAAPEPVLNGAGPGA